MYIYIYILIILNTCYHLFPKNFRCFPNKSSSKTNTQALPLIRRMIYLLLYDESTGHRKNSHWPSPQGSSNMNGVFHRGFIHTLQGIPTQVMVWGWFEWFPVWWDMWSFPGGYTFSKIWGEKCQFTQFTTTILHMIFLKWVSTPPPTMTIVRIVV